MIGSMLLGNGSGCSYRPNLHHGVLSRFAFELSLENNILRELISFSLHPFDELDTHIYSITPFFSNTSDCSKCSWGKHNPVVVDQRVLIDTTKDIASRNVIADLEVNRVKVPL